MTKRELAGRLRIREGLTWDQSKRIITDLFNDIADEVANGGEVYVPKFGRFFRGDVSQKKCKHPITKNFVTLPPRKVVRFRMAIELKRKLER